MSQCRTMLVGSKRPLLAAAATASPSADSKVLITEICSRSSFDRKFVAKKTCTATALFCRKTFRVETVIASPARTSIRCDESRPTTPRNGAAIVIFKIILIDAVGREQRSSEWFAARPRGPDIRCARAAFTMLPAIERDAMARAVFPCRGPRLSDQNLRLLQRCNAMRRFLE